LLCLATAEAKMVCGVASRESTNAPTGEKSRTSAPDRCQPRTVSSSGSDVPEDEIPEIVLSSLGLSAWRMIIILLAGIGPILMWFWLRLCTDNPHYGISHADSQPEVASPGAEHWRESGSRTR